MYNRYCTYVHSQWFYIKITAGHSLTVDEAVCTAGVLHPDL